MNSFANGSVHIQTSSESSPSTPPWFGEVVLITAYLRKHGILTKISECVRFARRRFGRYAISGESTLEGFYKRLQPFAVQFMALFDRRQLPARSTLSRFLAALTEAPVEALRALFLDDLLSRPLLINSDDSGKRQTGGLLDRAGNGWMVFDLDGTREAAANARYLKLMSFPPLFAVWMMCVLLATGAASVGK